MSNFRNLNLRNSDRTCDLGANIILTLEYSVIMNSRTPLQTRSKRREGLGASIVLWCCKNLIFSQYRVVVFVVKHLSFCQYGRVRSLWPKFLSPAFLNLWIHFRSLNVVLSPRFPTSESKSQNSISTNTPRTPLIFGQPSYMFFSYIYIVNM